MWKLNVMSNIVHWLSFTVCNIELYETIECHDLTYKNINKKCQFSKLPNLQKVLQYLVSFSEKYFIFPR